MTPLSNELTSDKEIRSNEVRVSAVSLTGSVTSASVWGLVGSQSRVTCVVPAGLTDTALTSIRSVSQLHVMFVRKLIIFYILQNIF